MKRAAISFGILSFFLISFDPFHFFLLVSGSGEDENSPVNLDDWEAPRELQQLFPYYISGLDKKGQPVFVMEAGKWEIRKYFEEGGDDKIADLYVDQMFHRFSKAKLNLPNRENVTVQEGRFVVIGDYDGLGVKQLTHGPSLYFLLTMARKFANGPANQLDYTFTVNVHPVAEAFVNNLVFPLVSGFTEKFTIVGTKSETWIPLLLEKIPAESLPPWYGGSSKSFRPLAVFG